MPVELLRMRVTTTDIFLVHLSTFYACAPSSKKLLNYGIVRSKQRCACVQLCNLGDWCFYSTNLLQLLLLLFFSSVTSTFLFLISSVLILRMGNICPWCRKNPDELYSSNNHGDASSLSNSQRSFLSSEVNDRTPYVIFSIERGRERELVFR